MLKTFFNMVTNHPIKVIITSLMILVAVAIGAKNIVKDTRADAFIPKGDLSLVNKDKLVELFGLTDPVVVVVENDKGVFNPKTLELVYKLSDDIQKMKEVKNDGITSLSTQKNIYGVNDGMEVEYFIQNPVVTKKEAKKAEYGVEHFPLIQGTLVAKDKKATLVIADLKDQKQAEHLYQKLMALTQKIKEKDIKLYVAGEGAVTGYMGTYIDADARRLNPIAAIIISLVLFIAFRRFGGVVLPNLVILGAVGMALGSMGHSHVAFFVITNAMPVVLIGIAVADSIHILSTYYERRRDYPDEKQQNAVVETMLEMWRPIGLTTLTTMAGFLGLTLSSSMPPMYYFGIFAMVGVASAWLFSITLLPAMMVKFKLKQSPLFEKKKEQKSKFVSMAAKWVSTHPKKILLMTFIISGVALFGALKMIVNEDRIETFHESESIVQADKVVNKHFNGSHYLDILVDTKQQEGLFNPEVAKKLEEFQTFVTTLPHVQGVTSYVDYLKQMNKSLNENNQKKYTLPPSANASAQYFLLYSARASSDDFENILDYDYQKANIRIYLNSGQYIHEREVIGRVQKYIDENLNSGMMDAQVSGRVNVDYHWILTIENSHFKSVAISLLLVLIMAFISFRKLSIAILVTTPVVLSILMIYGVMGYADIWLGVGTSMFASIAIGLGVDFAIHTAERMESLKKVSTSAYEQIKALYTSTGRALFFNALALILGFGILATSKVVPLVKFGSLVAVAISSSFLFSLLLIPAVMILMNRPKN